MHRQPFLLNGISLVSKYCRRLEAILLLNRLRYFGRLQQQFRVSIVDLQMFPVPFM
mgnify:CR=1 FL=1